MKESIRKAFTYGGIAAAAIALPVFLFAPGRATKRQKAPFLGVNFAHRGLHSRDKAVPENSLRAFELASAAGYGMELDVQLTKDGQVIVFHDDDLDRVCGVPGKIWDYTYEELQEFRLCGTDQRIPLFTDVLNTVAGRAPLIVELKHGPRNRELCKKTYAILSDYQGDVCIESFNCFIVAWFRFHARDLVRGQLTMRSGDYELGAVPSYLLSRCALNFLARPQFIARQTGHRPLSICLSEWLGAMKVVWTSHEPSNEKGSDAVIFEFYKPKVHFK